MATSNLPGYMEIKIEKFDGDTGTGEFNLSYDEIERYFLLGDGQLFIRIPNDFPSAPGTRQNVLGVATNVIVFGDSNLDVPAYMTGGSSKAFSLTEP